MFGCPKSVYERGPLMKILVLAGGYDQIALINELKQYGHTVLLADYFEHPPAEKFADAFFQISTLDEEAIEYLAKEEAVDMITTACTDQALLTVARVSEKLGLPCYIDAAKALCVTNKFYMKEIFKKHGIPTADYVLLEKGHNGCEAVAITWLHNQRKRHILRNSFTPIMSFL